MPRELTVKQRAFIAAYLTGIPATQAAIDAGYSKHSAKAISHQLMHDNELVKAELARVHQHMAKTAEYNAEQCLLAIDAFIAKADARGADSAIAKFHEQKMKLFGLLIDKQHIAVEKVDIAGALAEANGRLLRLRCDPTLAIEGEFEALPRFAGNRPIDEQSVRQPRAPGPDFDL